MVSFPEYTCVYGIGVTDGSGDGIKVGVGDGRGVHVGIIVGSGSFDN